MDDVRMNTVLNKATGENFIIWNGDCIEVMNALPENSVHLSIFSPPYASLYTYSNSDRDLGNSTSENNSMNTSIM